MEEICGRRVWRTIRSEQDWARARLEERSQERDSTSPGTAATHPRGVLKLLEPVFQGNGLTEIFAGNNLGCRHPLTRFATGLVMAANRVLS